MVLARMILVSAMLTAGIVETTKTATPRLAEKASGAERAPAAMPAAAVPSDPACTGAAWPYLPGSCLQPGAARRPVRMIEEQRPAAPARVPGRVSVG